MRTYGRVGAAGSGELLTGINAPILTGTGTPILTGAVTAPMQWVPIAPDPATGLTDLIYVATLAQCLKLSLGESPFYAQYGIPAQQSVMSQIPPDFYAARTQQQFAPFFASLIIARAPAPNPPPLRPVPTYTVSVLTHHGVRLQANVPIAT